MADFVARFLVCQQVKFEHRRLGEQIQPLESPKLKWEDITCDFVVGLPKTKKNHDAIWVVVDQLIKSAHSILVSMNMNM